MDDSVEDMTYDVSIRDERGNHRESWSEVKDFITYFRFNKLVQDKISDQKDKYISVDVFPEAIRTRYRGSDGKDRRINYVYTKDVVGFDIIF